MIRIFTSEDKDLAIDAMSRINKSKFEDYDIISETNSKVNMDVLMSILKENDYNVVSNLYNDVINNDKHDPLIEHLNRIFYKKECIDKLLKCGGYSVNTTINAIVSNDAHPRYIGLMARVFAAIFGKFTYMNFHLFTYSFSFINQMGNCVYRKNISKDLVEVRIVNLDGSQSHHPFDEEGALVDWPIDFFDEE